MLHYILGGIALFILWIIASYNGFVRLKNRFQEAWSDIETQMKRRYNLIPNLMETVKGYAKHEKETLDAVVKARTAAMSATGTPNEQAEAENMLQSTLKSIFALSESYPDLKANANFIDLQHELTDAEDKIQAARRFYNNTVQAFNTKVEMFPSNFIAKTFGFVRQDFFQLDEPAARKPVKVKF
ncbi:MAG: LemA family protein [Alphaproteobacteria bacterium]|nr:LemA family protein [Alphaproteobacteria bacterium]MBN2779721.1 LemA family protein [Alphaproteobacteria bacterium]